MDGFKDSTKMKYMTGGDVKAYKTGGSVPLQSLDYNLVSGGGNGGIGGKGSAPRLSPTIMRQPSSELGRLTGTAAPKGVGVTLKGRFKDGGPVKKALGGTLNERGKRATLAEMEAEDRRMGSSMPAKKPVGPSSVAVSKVLAGMAKKVMKKNMGGGVNSKLGSVITQAKANMAAAPRAKSTFVDTMPKGGPQKPSSGNPLMGGMNRGDIVASKHTPTTAAKVSVGLSHERMDAMQKREDAAYKARIASGEYSVKPKAPPTMRPTGMDKGPMSPKALPTRGPSMSPAFNDRPMIRRSKGGLSVMPKGKC